MKAIINLTRKDWEYHSLVFALLHDREMSKIHPTFNDHPPIDALVLFYKENNNNKLIGRFLFNSGNKLKFEKDNLSDDEMGSLEFLKDQYDIIKNEKYISEDKTGLNIIEKLENRTASDLDIKFTMRK